MSKQLALGRASDLLRKSDRFLMVTHLPDGAAFSVFPDGPISRKAGEALTSQGDLFPSTGTGKRPVMIPNNDGLFPGFSQTWRAAD